MVVGSPLVPCVVNPLVVALALVADLSVGVVGISDVPLLLSLGATEGTATGTEATGTTETTETLTSIAMSEAVTSSVALSVGEAISVIGTLVAVVLVVGTISLRLDSIVVGSLPSVGGNDSGGEKNGLEHF